jgi:localization factor PodJL
MPIAEESARHRGSPVYTNAAMKTGYPWRVKGITPQARETAREAARRHGLSVGEWLNAVIIDSAIAEGVAPARDLPGMSEVRGRDPEFEEEPRPRRRKYCEHSYRHGDEARSGAAQEDLQAIKERLDALAQFGRCGNPDGSDTGPAKPKTSSSAGPAGCGEPRPAAPEGANPLDQALLEIADRQRALDAQPAPVRSDAPRASTQDHGGANRPSRNFERSDKRGSGEVDPEFQELRRDLRGVVKASGVDRLSLLEQRIAAMGEAPQPRRQGENAQDLDHVIGKLDNEVRRLELERSGLVEARQLENRIAELIQKVDASDARLAQIEAIRWNLAELLARVENQPQLECGSATALPAVNSLKQEVMRTQGSLQAVNGTLGKVVERLSTIETGIRSAVAPAAAAAREPRRSEERLTSPAPIPATAPADQPAPIPALPALTPAAGRGPRPAAAASAPRPAAAANAPKRAASNSPKPFSAASVPKPPPDIEPPAPAARPAISPKPQNSGWRDSAALKPQRAVSAAAEPPIGPRPIEPKLPPNEPLEPGRSPFHAPAASPAERIAASEASLGPARLSVPESGPKPDFIAAARRAAQAANASFGHKASDESTGIVGGPVSAIAKRVRSLLVFAGVALIVVASLRIGMNLFGGHRDESTPPVEAMQAAPAGDDSPSAPAESAAGSTAAVVAAQSSDNEPPVPSAPPPSVDGRSDARSGGKPGPVATADAVVATRPAANRKSRSSAGAEPALEAAASTGTVRPAGLGPSSIPAAAVRPDPAPVQAPPGDDLPAGIGSNRLRAAAAGGDPAAQYEVAVRFAEGRGIPQNLPAAAQWFERAARQGLPQAQFRLGAIYERGIGIKKDRESAQRFYLAAAEAGNARAMHNLGVLYAEGMDGKPDYANAAVWFRNASEYGIADSQYNLGVLDALGMGIAADLGEACKLFALAARGNDKDAVKKRDEIGARLDPSSLAAARAAVAGWSPKVEPEAATTVKAPPGGWDDAAPPHKR